MEGLGLTGCQEVFQDSLAQAKETAGIIQDCEDIIMKDHVDGYPANAYGVLQGPV
jgi:hypothetical protein